MEQYIYNMRAYLPVEFEEVEINEFVEYFVNAYLENLDNEKYQFCLTAFHILYMTYVYKIQWFLKQRGDVGIESHLQNQSQQNKISFNSLFDLSQIQEKTSLEKLLLSLKFHQNDVGICKNHVEVRNNCSHASGRIYYKKAKQVEHFIEEEILYIEAIHNKVKPHLVSILDDLIKNLWNTNWLDNELQIWVTNNYLSQNEIKEILSFKPAFLFQLSNTKEIVYKKVLFCVLTFELTKHLSEKGSYFLETLKYLVNGLSESIDLSNNSADDIKLKSTQEIIEEKIVPILTNLSDSDASIAQEILKLDVA